MIEWPNMHLVVISPHADDEVLMAGGLMQLVGGLRIVTMSIGDTIHGSGSALLKAEQLRMAMDYLGWTQPVVLPPFSNQNGELYEREGLRKAIKYLDGILAEEKPDVVILPKPSHHQDHRFTFDAAMAALRPKEHNPMMVLLGEYPHTIINPYETAERSHMYVKLTEEQVEKKKGALELQEMQISSSVATQPDIIFPWARMRGLECCQRFAERFEIARFWMTWNG